jgi:hypothetical protein
MIIVQDRIAVAGADLPRLRALLEQRYLPGARARGLILLDSGVSPPLTLADEPCVFWMRWRLDDVGAFWTARGMAVQDPSVAAFWDEVDRFCTGRHREFLRPDGFAREPLPEPASLTAFLTEPQGWRETAQLHLRPTVDRADRDALEAALSATGGLPGVRQVHLGTNLDLQFGAGHYTWDVRYDDAAAAEAVKASAHWTQTLMPLLNRLQVGFEPIALATVAAGSRQPGLTAGIKRTALFRLLPGVGDEQRRAFERNQLAMPAYIPEILNWRLSRALPAAGRPNPASPDWSYVWEQEYADLAGLAGAYMAHPYHWAYLDGSFDPESGRQIVDARLCHAYCAMSRGILGAESDSQAP